MFVCSRIGVDDLAFCTVDLDRRGAGSREELGGCYGEGEDVSGVCGGEGVGLEVLF